MDVATITDYPPLNLEISTRNSSMNKSLLLAALIALTLTACGKKEEAAAPAAPAPVAAPAAEAPKPAEAAPAPAAADAAKPADAAAAPAANNRHKGKKHGRREKKKKKKYNKARARSRNAG